MKSELERYLLALAEQEESTQGPETLQDLGTFVHWLIERLGYIVHVRAFKQSGVEREKTTGRLQLGIDILATKEEGGQLRLYRFVLKHGPVNVPVWGRSGNQGNIVHDVRLAATKNRTRDYEDHIFQGQKPERVTVVAVHNGPFDSHALGDPRKQLEEELQGFNVALQWWDINKLVELASPLLGSSPDGEAAVDAGVFPPGVRPFARLALDSLRRHDGAEFDLRAVDDFLEAKLPLGRELTKNGATERLLKGEPLPALSLHRRARELTLFTAMITAESKRSGRGLTLPTFDTIERCICRIAEHAQRHDPSSTNSDLRALRSVVEELLRQYVLEAQALDNHLTPLRSVSYGLAVGSTSERIDYPLRCLRLLGYLAVAGLACLDLGGLESQAGVFAEAILDLWKSNAAACESPVTDDQCIELDAIWRLFLRLGRHAEVGEMSSNVVHRLLARRLLGLPLPGLYQLAKLPMDERDVRALVEAHILGRGNAFGFEDGGSTLLALAAYLAYRHGGLEPNVLAQFGAHEVEDRSLDACCLQAWCPDAESADEWYAHPIMHWGFAHSFDHPENKDLFVTEFEIGAKPVTKSYALQIELPVVDVIAWKRWRTLPDYSLFAAHSMSGAVTTSSQQENAVTTLNNEKPRSGRGGRSRAKRSAKRDDLH